MKNYLKLEALAYVRDGAIQRGIDKYNEYLALEPNRKDDDAWASLGGAYRRLDNLDEALDCYEQAYTLNPNSSYALVNLVSLQISRNSQADKENIKVTIPEAIKLCRDKIFEYENESVIEGENQIFWTWYDLATLHLIEGKYEEALNIFYHAVALTPVEAKEYFRSVLSNLLFLHKHNPSIYKLDEVITLISKYAD